MRSSKPRKSIKKDPDQGAAAKIIEAATTLFATLGYDGTSTKEICRKAKVNIAAIHYHFGSKEELYRKVIGAFGGARLSLVERILVEPKSLAEFKLRLEMFLTDSLGFFLQHPELCRLVQVEIELLHSRSESVFRDTFVKMSETLISFLSHAKESGLIRKSVDPKIAAHFFLSQLRQATRSDAINHKYFGFSIRDESYRNLWIKQTLEIFLGGTAVLAKESK